MNLFDILLYQPLFNILIVIYEYFPGHDFGIAIVALTVLIRIVLYPLVARSIRVQKIVNEIQPQLKDIKDKCKGDKEKEVALTMQLYRDHNIGLFSGIGPILVQLPVILALYWVFQSGFQQDSLQKLYGFIPRPEAVNPFFLGVVNLSAPNLALAVVAGILQFVQTKMVMPPRVKAKDQTSQFANMLQQQSLYIFPVVTVFILFQLPAAVGLYWVTTSLFQIAQQFLVFKKSPAAGK